MISRCAAGHVYGSVLVNMGTHRPVDLLPDREADTFAAWLRAHPGTQVICRDRAGAYADGARAGAPGAIQVADRWHLWHNLAERVEKAVARHRSCLIEPEPELPAGVPEPDLQQVAAEAAAAADRRVRPGAGGLAGGMGRCRRCWPRATASSRLCASWGLAKETVRRFARAASAGRICWPRPAAGGRPCWMTSSPTCTSGGTPALTNVLQLHAEIKAAGYQGSYAIVRALPAALPRPRRSPATSARTAEGPPRGQLDSARSGHPGRRRAGQAQRRASPLPPLRRPGWPRHRIRQDPYRAAW